MRSYIYPIALIAFGLGTAAQGQNQPAPGQPAQPGQSGQPAQPRPAQPAQPRPAQPTQPAQGAQPGQPRAAQPPQSSQSQARLSVLPEFKSVDANENGSIEATETRDLAKMLQDEHEVVFQFESVDRNRDGMINSQEYVAYDGVLKQRLGIS